MAGPHTKPNFITFVKKERVNISGYIADLLEEQDYVTIPGIGALMALYQPAAFDKESGTLMPPSRLVTFNPGLTVNDGMLAAYIARKEKMALSRARLLVDQFADDVAYRLHRNETVDLGKIGNLTPKDDRIEFTPHTGSASLPGSFGLERVTLPPIARQQAPPVAIHGKRKRIPVWAMIAAILLPLLLLVFLLPDRDKIHKRVNQNDSTLSPPVHEQPVSILPSAPVDTVSETTTVAAADSFPLTGEKRFYLVGGSFKSAQNAGEYITKMEAKGFHPVLLGKTGSFFVVALDSFLTAREASKAMEGYGDRLPDADFWIYQKRN